MNKLNFYLTLLALLTAVSVLDYISEEYKNFIKITFYIASFGFILKMILENFDFKIERCRTIIEKIEDNIFYIITLFMVAFITSSFFSIIFEMINLNINKNILYSFFGILGVLFKMVVKKKANNELK